MANFFRFVLKNQANWFPSEFANVGTGEQGLGGYIALGLKYLFIGAAIVAVVYIIFAGYKYITAGGDSGKAQEAQKQIMYAIIGLVIALVSYAVVELVWTQITNQEQLPNLEFEENNNNNNNQ